MRRPVFWPVRLVAALAVLASTACRDEPSFEERYGRAQQRIQGQAQQMEAELREGLATDAAADPAAATPEPD